MEEPISTKSKDRERVVHLETVRAVFEGNPAGSRTVIRFDMEGRESLGVLSKAAVMNEMKIPTRDLRVLEPLLSYPPAILVRPQALVCNLEHVRVIISSSSVLVLNPHDPSVGSLLQELRRRLPTAKVPSSNPALQLGGVQSAALPYEHRALEAVLISVCMHVETAVQALETAVLPALDALTSKVDSIVLERVRKLKSRMSRLIVRVTDLREVMEALLDKDEDMRDMYLSKNERVSIIPRTRSAIDSSGLDDSNFNSSSSDSHAKAGGIDVQELEIMLEAYFMQVDATFNKLSTLREYIDDTEDYINIELDSKRNQLMQLDLIMTAVTMTFALGSYIAGIFGMNLPSGLLENDSAFLAVTGSTSGFMIGSFIAILFYCKYQKLI